MKSLSLTDSDSLSLSATYICNTDTLKVYIREHYKGHEQFKAKHEYYLYQVLLTVVKVMLHFLYIIIKSCFNTNNAIYHNPHAKHNRI